MYKALKTFLWLLFSLLDEVKLAMEVKTNSNDFVVKNDQLVRRNFNTRQSRDREPDCSGCNGRHHRPAGPGHGTLRFPSFKDKDNEAPNFYREWDCEVGRVASEFTGPSGDHSVRRYDSPGNMAVTGRLNKTGLGEFHEPRLGSPRPPVF